MTTTQPATDVAKTMPRPRSVLMDLGDRFSMDPRALEKTLRATCFSSKPGEQPSGEEFAAFCIVARDYGLNPLTREIYGFKAKSGAIVPIVGIDGWLSLANRREEFDGLEVIDVEDEDGKLVAATAIVHRKDRAHATRITEHLSECQRSTEPWAKWPRRMLRHKATIQAIRYAFSISGIYEPDEAERADFIDVTPARPTREDFDSKDPAGAGSTPAGAGGNPGGEHEVTEKAAGGQGVNAPAVDPRTGMSDAERERVEREADRMQRAAESGEPVDDEEKKATPMKATPVPLKKDGSPDWIKWHTSVAQAVKSLVADAAIRARFLAAHEPALLNYAQASPQNAANLRALIETGE